MQEMQNTENVKCVCSSNSKKLFITHNFSINSLSNNKLSGISMPHFCKKHLLQFLFFSPPTKAPSLISHPLAALTFGDGVQQVRRETSVSPAVPGRTVVRLQESLLLKSWHTLHQLFTKPYPPHAGVYTTIHARINSSTGNLPRSTHHSPVFFSQLFSATNNIVSGCGHVLFQSGVWKTVNVIPKVCLELYLNISTYFCPHKQPQLRFVK